MVFCLQRYGLIGSFRLARDWALTRLLFPQARLIRSPFYFRGQRHMKIGAGFTTGVGTRLDCFSESLGVCLVIGKNVQLNDYVHIAAIRKVEIGDDVLIASRVFITDHDHGLYSCAEGATHPDIAPAARPLSSKPVIIGRNAWIGEQVCILAGVTVGEGSIVGAGAIVTRDVAPGCIAVGNPARVVRRFDTGTGKWLRT